MPNLISNILNYDSFIIIIFSSLTLIAFIILFSIFLTKKSRVKKGVRNLEQKLNKLKDSNLTKKVEKLRKLSEKNEEFSDVYDETKKEFDVLSIDKVADLEDEIDKINFPIQEKKFKDAKQLTKKTNQKIEKLSLEYKKIEDKLNLVFKREQKARELLVPIKEKYRKLSLDFKEKKDKFLDCQDSFNSYIKDSYNQILKIEELLEEGLFDEALEKCKKIEPMLDYYLNHLEKLPELISFALNILPKRFESTLLEYQKMKDEGYPLFNIKILTLEKKLKEEFEAFKKALCELNYENIKTKMNEVSKKIQRTNEKLEEEKEAKIKFEESKENVFSRHVAINKKLTKAIREIQKLENYYVISDEKKHFLENMKNNLYILDRVKSELDGYIHSLTKQPFSNLNTKLIDIKNRVTHLEDDIAKYFEYIKSLKENSTDAYIKANEYSIEINDIFSKIRERNHKILVTKYDEEVSQILDELKKLEEYIKNKPIDVDIATKMKQNVSIKSEELLNKMNDDLSLLQIASSVLVFANQYRSAFSDVDEVLNHASLNYERGDFEFAIDQISEVLKEVHPSAYSEMMKEKEVSNG